MTRFPRCCWALTASHLPPRERPCLRGFPSLSSPSGKRRHSAVFGTFSARRGFPSPAALSKHRPIKLAVPCSAASCGPVLALSNPEVLQLTTYLCCYFSLVFIFTSVSSGFLFLVRLLVLPHLLQCLSEPFLLRKSFRDLPSDVATVPPASSPCIPTSPYLALFFLNSIVFITF